MKQIVRLLTFLQKRGWADHKKHSVFLFDLFAEHILELSMMPDLSNIWIYKAFIVSFDLNWNLPGLHQLCMKLILNEDWKHQV